MTTATSASAYAPDPAHLDRLTSIYGPGSTYDTDPAEIAAAAREHAYLTAIAQTLADSTTGPVMEGVLDTASHTFIPMLTFPTLTTATEGFTVWAEWEGGGHEFNIVPFAADHFPDLPSGTEAGDHLIAAEIIRAYAQTKGLL